MLKSHTYWILILWMRVKAGLECVVANPATIHKSKEKGTVKDKFQNIYYATAKFLIVYILTAN